MQTMWFTTIFSLVNLALSLAGIVAFFSIPVLLYKIYQNTKPQPTAAPGQAAQSAQPTSVDKSVPEQAEPSAACPKTESEAAQPQGMPRA